MTGYEKAARILQETLDEKSTPNEKLPRIAESYTNVEARQSEPGRIAIFENASPYDGLAFFYSGLFVPELETLLLLWYKIRVLPQSTH